MIPALDGSTNRAQDDGKVEGGGLAPFVQDFVADGVLFGLGQAWDGFKSRGVFCDQSAFDKEVCEVLEVVFFGKLFHILDHLLV